MHMTFWPTMGTAACFKRGASALGANPTVLSSTRHLAPSMAWARLPSCAYQLRSMAQRDPPAWMWRSTLKRRRLCTVHPERPQNANALRWPLRLDCHHYPLFWLAVSYLLLTFLAHFRLDHRLLWAGRLASPRAAQKGAAARAAPHDRDSHAAPPLRKRAAIGSARHLEAYCIRG